MAYRLALAALLCGTSMWTETALAQAAQPDGAGPNQPEEILVTARRRAERIQDVPVAVTAVSGEQLSRKGVIDVMDLRRAAPALNISESPGSGRNMLQFTLRGQRLGDNLPSVDPSVGTYLGDQLFKRTYGLNNLIFDLQTVEVLKGPQGTLFGLNVTGGNVIFRPNLPTNEFAASVRTMIGNYDQRQVEGFVNVPLGEGAALRVAGQYRKRGSTVRNINDPTAEYGSEDGGAIRGTLKLNPTDAIESITTASWSKQSGGGSGFKIRYVRPGSVADLVYNQQNCFTFTCPFYPVGALNAQVALSNSLDGHTITAGAVGGTPVRSFADLDYAWNVANTTTLRISDTISVKNIVGYRKYSAQGFEDVDGSNLPILEYGFAPRGEEFSEELQLIGSSPGFNWIIGGYFFREVVKAGNAPRGTLGQSVNILSPLADGSQNPYNPIDNDWNTTKSVFASATKDLDFVTSGLSLTLGARYTWDTRRADFGTIYGIGFTAGDTVPTNGFPASGPHCAFNPVTDPAILQPQYHYDPATCLVHVSKDFSKLSYSTSLDWKFAPGKMIYIAHRLGYRAGAWSTRAVLAAGVRTADPEEVRDYEIGVKLDWRLGGTFLRTNFAYYYQDYKNIQRLTPFQQGFTTGTNFVNAQKASIQGFEAEATFEPTDWLTLSGFAAYTKPKYKKFLYDSDFNGSLDQDITNLASFGGVSEWQASANAELKLPLPAEVGEGRLNVNYYYQSSYWLQDNPFQLPGGQTPGYGLVGARLELNKIAGTGLNAALFASNLFNKDYVSARYVLTDSVGFVSDIPGLPRLWGFELRYNF